MIQGDVYQYKFKMPNKLRPVLALTRFASIPVLNTVTVAEIATTIRGNETEVSLDELDRLKTDYVINMVNIFKQYPKTNLVNTRHILPTKECKKFLER